MVTELERTLQELVLCFAHQTVMWVSVQRRHEFLPALQPAPLPPDSHIIIIIIIIIRSSSSNSVVLNVLLHFVGFLNKYYYQINVEWKNLKNSVTIFIQRCNCSLMLRLHLCD